ncbi:hypothetical protein FMEAI12_3050005 [Parafrankia sp. Ea1.12]|nr:hypothetical protein FMEAI12_3050005 [Parafrankia sp. Ea1.12]
MLLPSHGQARDCADETDNWWHSGPRRTRGSLVSASRRPLRVVRGPGCALAAETSGLV